jgi:hypothetical protein
MAQFVTSADSTGSYRGLPRLFEFVNEDGAMWRYNCGQAAVATLLQFLSKNEEAKASTVAGRPPWMSWLEKEHPPDNLGGWLGTSRRRVERGLRGQGYRPRAIHGEESLRRCLAAGLPVILTVQLSVRFWKFDFPSAHWMVAFGYDEQYVYLTNRWEQRMPWPEFRRGWNGWIPALTNMRGTGIVAPVPPAAPVADWHKTTPG